MDFYLWRLNLVENRLKRLSQPLVEQQLAYLIRLYRIRHVGYSYMIESMPQRDSVEKIKGMLSRLLHIESDLHKFLEDPGYLSKEVTQLISKFGEKRLDHFSESRLSDIARIDQLFADEKNQYIVIHGVPGCGKTALAIEYAYTHAHEYTVRFVNSAQYLLEISYWGHLLDIHKEDFTTIKAYVDQVKQGINNYVPKTNKRLLFILNSVASKRDEALAQLSYDFDKRHVKFLVTTKLENVSPHFEQIPVLAFDIATCLDYVRQRNMTIMNLTEEEWIDIFKLIGSPDKKNSDLFVLPLDLEKLLRKIETESDWTYKEIRIYLENERDNNYSIMKHECPLAYDLLSHLAYLNEGNISFELIRSIFIDKTKEEFDEALKYLTNTCVVKMVNIEQDCSLHEVSKNLII